MKQKAFLYLLTFFGLLLGNFLFQAVFDQNWAFAFEIAFFQGFAFVASFISELVTGGFQQ